MDLLTANDRAGEHPAFYYAATAKGRYPVMPVSLVAAVQAYRRRYIWRRRAMMWCCWMHSGPALAHRGAMAGIMAARWTWPGHLHPLREMPINNFIAATLRKPMLEIFPLKDTRINYAWGGTLGKLAADAVVGVDDALVFHARQALARVLHFRDMGRANCA